MVPNDVSDLLRKRSGRWPSPSCSRTRATSAPRLVVKLSTLPPVFTWLGFLLDTSCYSRRCSLTTPTFALRRVVKLNTFPPVLTWPGLLPELFTDKSKFPEYSHSSYITFDRSRRPRRRGYRQSRRRPAVSEEAQMGGRCGRGGAASSGGPGSRDRRPHSGGATPGAGRHDDALGCPAA